MPVNPTDTKRDAPSEQPKAPGSEPERLKLDSYAEREDAVRDGLKTPPPGGWPKEQPKKRGPHEG